MKPMPITYVWRNGHLRPLDRYAKYAARQFGEEGSEHTLEPTSMRNMASHSHYYAALTEAYNNLPDSQASKYPSLEHFRKSLLVAAGYCDTEAYVFVDADEASKKAPLFRKRDAFCIISINDNVVIVKYAKSQDLANMNKFDFEASKKAVLELASSMIAVSVGELKRNAGRST